MKLSISNIAWPNERDERYLRRIGELGCRGVEIAASKIWPEPTEAEPGERKAYLAFVRGFGLEISAIQALLYTRPDLNLFGAPQERVRTSRYLTTLCRLASDLEARVLVFGSPRNRRLGGTSLGDAFEQAVDIFSAVGTVAEQLGVILCVEPLSSVYTDFVNTVAEGLQLVKAVGSSGFGLHLDAAAMADEESDPGGIMRVAGAAIRHFHISEPELGPVGVSGKVAHSEMAGALGHIGYTNYVSIEMREQTACMTAVEGSVRMARSLYRTP